METVETILDEPEMLMLCLIFAVVYLLGLAGRAVRTHAVAPARPSTSDERPDRARKATERV
jgi:hypothetical protein